MFYIKDICLLLKRYISNCIFVKLNLNYQRVKTKNMAIQFKMVPKRNMLSAENTVNYYPCAISQGEVDLDKLAAIVASRSTISPADCYGVIHGLSEVIAQMLMEGKIVKIEKFGSLKITLQGTPASNDEDLGKKHIRKINVIYKPAKELMRKLKGATFKRVR